MSAIRVSFVIPHKGREELLKATLQSIVNQGFPKDQMEVVVVTQNLQLEPTTCPVDTDLKVTTLTQPVTDTISRLRNVGVSAAEGEFIAFLDADIELSHNWVSTMLDELLSDSRRVLVSAIQECDDRAEPLEMIRTVMSNAVVDSDVRFLPGRNLFLRRKTFSQAGGFPEHLVTCEDYYFTDKVHELGALYYTSRASYVHLGEDKQYVEMFKKEIWRGQSNFQSIRGRHIPLAEWPSFLVPIWILLFFLGALGFAVLGQPGLALASLLLVLIPIALYSLRLKRLAKGKVSLFHILCFYFMYFPARIIGTYYGLFAIVRV